MFLVVLFVACSNNPATPVERSTAATTEAPAEQQSLPLNFITEPSCGPHAPLWCSISRPISWDDDSIARTTDLFRRLLAFQGANGVVAQFFESDYNALVRTQTGFTFTDPFRREPPIQSDGNPAWVAHDMKRLFLSDRFIASYLGTDPLGHFDPRLLVLLHELFHVSDARYRYSESSSFREMYGRVLSMIDVPACRRLLGRWRRATADGWDEADWTTARLEMKKLGTRVGTGHYLPSVATCGLEDPAEAVSEAFADFGAYWLIDPSARSSFPAPVEEWLEGAVPKITQPPIR